MGVIVVGDVTHVVIQCPVALAQYKVGNLGECDAKTLLQFLGWSRVMRTPDHHWNEADLAVGNPADVVFEVARRDDRRLTEIALERHCTFNMTVACHLTWVPATGTDETTLVHLVVFAFGPRVM